MNDTDTLLRRCERAQRAADALLRHCLGALRDALAGAHADEGRALQLEQARAHGVAWAATYVYALQQMLGWAQRLHAADRLGELESLLLQAAYGEYLAQLTGGLPMSQGETFRADALDADGSALAAFNADAGVRQLRAEGFAPAARQRIAARLAEGAATRSFGDPGYDDAALYEVRTQFARFADDHAEAAHGWHLRNQLIPDAVIAEMAHLGVFGLTIGEAHGGAGMGKSAMCVVTEELARGFIGLGSLGTRTEIAAELIERNGTPAQKARLLPAIASGALIPTASFTEPDVGSDLGAIRTRAEKVDGGWRIHGNKTWTTHGARSDLMTLMVRTDPAERGYKGLSMLLAEKPRGSDDQPFPAAGMRGSEIEVLGYRGMKEYEIAFDGFFVPDDALLGGATGQGFKQLMQTFESARIQTAARAVGVAQNAFELGLAYAQQRTQFGAPIIAFPRVADKLAWMAVETMVARQLTLFAAREKDAHRRCDLEAGMAKLLAARVAWANADNALQVHGGNGYALEYRISRVLCDARILNVFEGAAEIQANIVIKGLLAL
ncbi:MAG TPA: acyl-CoA dehydrogenase family protein [Rubrivivax sp.]|nr:acyl-CoA dehydrogenase family protein [Rubrivivax sp.]